ncbi:unnamed protein product [Heligmosomoides polygyrus]|uniref:BLVR domain-containing protein n=1 Tax=Heligmosomoides polygyrus TaxID=6339 RepID=A0A183F378_HELPZ|nr:unnamed protein product [Heligmosomoides polygyrus]
MASDSKKPLQKSSKLAQKKGGDESSKEKRKKIEEGSAPTRKESDTSARIKKKKGSADTVGEGSSTNVKNVSEGVTDVIKPDRLKELKEILKEKRRSRERLVEGSGKDVKKKQSTAALPRDDSKKAVRKKSAEASFKEISRSQREKRKKSADKSSKSRRSLREKRKKTATMAADIEETQEEFSRKAVKSQRSQRKKRKPRSKEKPDEGQTLARGGPNVVIPEMYRKKFKTKVPSPTAPKPKEESTLDYWITPDGKPKSLDPDLTDIPSEEESNLNVGKAVPPSMLPAPPLPAAGAALPVPVSAPRPSPAVVDTTPNLAVSPGGTARIKKATHVPEIYGVLDRPPPQPQPLQPKNPPLHVGEGVYSNYNKIRKSTS